MIGELKGDCIGKFLESSGRCCAEGGALIKNYSNHVSKFEFHFSSITLSGITALDHNPGFYPNK
jgi:hypothetical protein